MKIKKKYFLMYGISTALITFSSLRIASTYFDLIFVFIGALIGKAMMAAILIAIPLLLIGKTSRKMYAGNIYAGAFLLLSVVTFLGFIVSK